METNNLTSHMYIYMGTSARRHVLMNDEHMTNRMCIYGHKAVKTNNLTNPMYIYGHECPASGAH